MAVRNMTANDLTKQILQYLDLVGVLAWRNNSGLLPDANGVRRIRAGAVGSGDVLAVMPPEGRFLSIEVKVGKDRVRDSQRDWNEKVRRRGGRAIVARSLQDVIDVVEEPR